MAGKTTLPALPSWARHVEDGVVEANPDKFYPALMKELEIVKDDLDQYWLEVMYQMMKLDLQKAMGKFGFRINMLNRPDWALAKFAPGKGIHAATKGKEARAHYIRLRGALPA